MNKKTLGIALLLIGILVAGFYALNSYIYNEKQEPNPPLEPNQASQAEEVLNRLPHTITAGSRTVVLDRTTLLEATREEYSFRQATTLPQPGEDPVDYIVRILLIRLASQNLDQEPPQMYRFASSFYSTSDNAVSAYVRVSNLPDDSVGAGEERFDLVYDNEQWSLEWYGLRSFCQRPEQEYWSPADQLCP